MFVCSPYEISFFSVTDNKFEACALCCYESLLSDETERDEALRALLLRHALEHRESLGLRLRLEHVLIGEILRLRIAACSDTRCRILQIVARAPQHDLWPKQQPVRSRITVGHADAARVHDAHAINGAIELHMRVPTDHDTLPDAGQHIAQALLWRRRSHHLLVAARRAVAEEHFTQPINSESCQFRQLSQKIPL